MREVITANVCVTCGEIFVVGCGNFYWPIQVYCTHTSVIAWAAVSKQPVRGCRLYGFKLVDTVATILIVGPRINRLPVFNSLDDNLRRKWFANEADLNQAILRVQDAWFFCCNVFPKLEALWQNVLDIDGWLLWGRTLYHSCCMFYFLLKKKTLKRFSITWTILSECCNLTFVHALQLLE